MGKNEKIAKTVHKAVLLFRFVLLQFLVYFCTLITDVTITENAKMEQNRELVNELTDGAKV